MKHEAGCFNGFYVVKDKDGTLHFQREVGFEPLESDFKKNEVEAGTFAMAYDYFISTQRMARRDRKIIPIEKVEEIKVLMKAIKPEDAEKIEADKLTKGAIGWLSKENARLLYKK